MAEFIGNTFGWLISTIAEGITAIIQTASSWFGVWGAVAALILIGAIIKRAR